MSPIKYFNTLKLAVLVTAGMASFTTNAQIGNDKLNVTMELTLPSGRANPAFRAYLNGLVNVQPKLQYKFAKNWFIAGGPKYSYATVSEFKVPQKTNGGAHTYGGFMEVGWAKWQSRYFGIEFGVKMGAAQTVFITDLTRATGIQRITAPYVEPTFSLVLAADEAVAYRWIVGYNISGYKFKPYQLGMTTNGGFDDSDLNSFSQSIVVGFGMSYYFHNQRSNVFIDNGNEP
jgi:hypothetical protein